MQGAEHEVTRLGRGQRKANCLEVAQLTDEDHVGGLPRLLASTRVDLLVMPRWMLADDQAAELLIAARRRGTRVELALDRGRILGHASKQREQAICEVELELLRGDPLVMLDLFAPVLLFLCLV